MGGHELAGPDAFSLGETEGKGPFRHMGGKLNRSKIELRLVCNWGQEQKLPKPATAPSLAIVPLPTYIGLFCLSVGVPYRTASLPYQSRRKFGAQVLKVCVGGGNLSRLLHTCIWLMWSCPPTPVRKAENMHACIPSGMQLALDANINPISQLITRPLSDQYLDLQNYCL